MNNTYDEIQEGFDAVLNNIDKTEEGLSRMKKAELVIACEDIGLVSTGTKKEIIERLKEYFSNIIEVTSEIVAVNSSDVKPASGRKI